MSTWKISAVLAPILAALTLLAQEQPSDVIFIEGATVIDGTGRPPIKDGVIVIHDDRIQDIGSDEQVWIPQGARKVDATGKWIIPGLIDAHAHFAEADVVANTFERYLESGVTSVANFGGTLANIRDMDSTTDVLPRVSANGPLISINRRSSAPFPQESVVRATSPAHARELVRRQLDHRPDVIELWFDPRSEKEYEQQLPILSAAIDESRSRGVRVAVHATVLESARAAVRVGADILLGGINDRLVDRPFIRLAKSRDILYMTTLNKRGSASANVVRLHSAGVRIVGAYEKGAPGENARDAFDRQLQLMSDAGLRPLDIIISVTRNAAAVMGRHHELGVLQPGKLADLVILNDDPLADIRSINSVWKVMKGGRLAP